MLARYFSGLACVIGVDMAAGFVCLELIRLWSPEDFCPAAFVIANESASS
jgi:hypothetical protein